MRQTWRNFSFLDFRNELVLVPAAYCEVLADILVLFIMTVKQKEDSGARLVTSVKNPQSGNSRDQPWLTVLTVS